MQKLWRASDFSVSFFNRHDTLFECIAGLQRIQTPGQMRELQLGKLKLIKVVTKLTQYQWSCGVHVLLSTTGPVP